MELGPHLSRGGQGAQIVGRRARIVTAASHGETRLRPFATAAGPELFA
jgi:hypothetical protein